MRLQRLRKRDEKAMASSDKTAKAVFKVNAARALKVRRASKKESKVTFNDLGKERSSTSRRNSRGQLSVKVVEEDPIPTLTLTLAHTVTLTVTVSVTLTRTLTRTLTLTLTLT